MSNPEFIPELRLIVQASIPIDCVADGQNLYHFLKQQFLKWDENSTLNGQIIEMLEHCCNKSKGKRDDTVPDTTKDD
jgi:hypothetical protein